MKINLLSKTILLIILIILLSIFIYLILNGSVADVNGRCIYKGPLAGEDACLAKYNYNVPTNPFNNNDSNNTDSFIAIPEGFVLYKTEDYSISYPQDWYQDSDKIKQTIIFSEYKLSTTTDFNDNITITYEEEKLQITESACNNLANMLQMELSNSETYSAVNLVSTKVQKLYYENSCIIMFNNTINGMTINQKMYIFANDTISRVYYLTTSIDKGSKNIEIVEKSAGSFKFN